MDASTFEGRTMKKHHFRHTTFSEVHIDEIILHTPDTRGNPSRIRPDGVAVPHKTTWFRLVLAALASNAPFLLSITFGADPPIFYILVPGLLLMLILACATAKSPRSILVFLHSTCFGLLFSVYIYACAYGSDSAYSRMMSIISLSSTLSITPEFFPSCRQNLCRVKFSACLTGSSLVCSLLYLLHRTCPIPLCVAVMVHQMACFLFLLSGLRDSSVNSADPLAGTESLSAMDKHELHPVPESLSAIDEYELQSIPDIETATEVEDAIAD